MKEQYAFQIDAKGLVSYNNSFEDLMKDIEKYKKKDYRILILSPSATRGKRIAKNLQDNDVMAYFTENREQPLKPGEVRISVGRMETGFEIPECHLLVIAEGDIFTSKELKKRKKICRNMLARRLPDFRIFPLAIMSYIKIMVSESTVVSTRWKPMDA